MRSKRSSGGKPPLIAALEQMTGKTSSKAKAGGKAKADSLMEALAAMASRGKGTPPPDESIPLAEVLSGPAPYDVTERLAEMVGDLIPVSAGPRPKRPGRFYSEPIGPNALPDPVHKTPIGPTPLPEAMYGEAVGPDEFVGPRPQRGYRRGEAKARNRANFEAGEYEGVEAQTPSALARLRGRAGVGGMVGMGAGALGAVGLLGQLMSAGGSMPETGGIGLQDAGAGDRDLEDMMSMVNAMKAQAGSPRFAAGDPEMRAFIEGEWDRVAQASMPVGRSLREAMAARGHY